MCEETNKYDDKSPSSSNKENDKSSTEEQKSSKYGWLFLWSFLGIAALGMFIVWQGNFLFFSSSEKPIYIALAGPVTGNNGQAMVKGVQLYIEQVNQQGGINGQPLKLLIFDDKNEVQLAPEKALEIAKNSEAIAVIGHYNSSTSVVAAPIYQQYGIPAISGSATADELTQDNDWYFRTIFNNTEQAALLANYVSKVLNYKDAYILFDEDVYGSTLATAFTQNAKMIGLEVKQQWSYNSPVTFKKALNNMLRLLKSSPNKQYLLFLATHSTEAVEVAVAIKRLNDINVQIVGADAVSSKNFLKKLQKYPQEQSQPGYYSDGIYLTSPLLFDVASEYAQNFRYAFSKRYKEVPMITSAIYHDAAKVLVDAIQKTVDKGYATASLTEKRKQVKNNLGQLAQIGNAVNGVTGSLYFDENGDIVKSIPIGVYKHGKATVAMRQYQPLQSVDNVDNLLPKILENKIVEVNGKFMNLAKVVYVGMDFTDISELNTKKFTFTADFYLWFRFKGDFDDRDIEIVNLFEQKKYPLDEPMSVWHSPVEEGIITKTYRLKAQFKVDLNFRKFPLDQQILSVFLRHKKLTKNQLIYVVDRQGMNLAKFDNQNNKVKNFFAIGGWQINKAAFFQNTLINDSTLGITSFFGTQQRIEYSQFNARIFISRHILSFILKTLLPVIFLIVLGYFAFFINTFSSKLSIGTNLILATSLFHLKLVSELPKISYLVLIEYFFYLVYFLAIFIIIIAVGIHLYEDEDEGDEKDSKKDKDKGLKLIARLNLAGKIIYPLLLLGFVGLIFYQNYNLILGIN